MHVYDINCNKFENSLTNSQAFLSFYIHLGYYKNMAVCIYTSTDLYQTSVKLHNKDVSKTPL